MFLLYLLHKAITVVEGLKEVLLAVEEVLVQRGKLLLVRVLREMVVLEVHQPFRVYQ